MDTKHTPGPWRLVADRGHYDTLTTIEGGVIGARRPFGVEMIVQVGGDTDYQKLEANARLIAVAPELLEALQECADDLESEIQARAAGELPRRINRDMETVRRARGVIARAIGLGWPSNAALNGGTTE